MTGPARPLPPGVRSYRNPTGTSEASGQAGQSARTFNARQLLPWWEYPWENSQNFNAFAQQLTLNPSSTITAACSYTVPDGALWVVRGVTIFVQSPDPTFNASWFLVFNNVTQGSAFQTFGRTATSVEVPFPLSQIGQGPGTLQINIVNNSGAGPWTVGAAFTGWTTPKVTVDNVFGPRY